MAQAQQHRSPALAETRDSLRTALWQARISQGIIAVLLVLVAGTFVYSLTAEPSVSIDQEKLMAEVKERVVANSDKIVAEATSFAAETLPPVSSAIAHQAREDLPIYLRALEEQDDELIAGLELQLKKQFKAQSEDYLARHREVFREVFPEITEEKAIDRILQDFRQTARRLMERYYLDEFRIQAKRTAKLWKSFEPVEPPQEGTLEEQLLEYSSDWLVLNAKDTAVDTIQPND